MENVDKKECGGCGDSKCSCGGCKGGMRGCCGGKFCLIKIILKIIIVVLIFGCGFKLGEIVGSVRGEGVRSNFGMMRGGGYGTLPNVTLPNNGATTP